MKKFFANVKIFIVAVIKLFVSNSRPVSVSEKEFKGKVIEIDNSDIRYLVSSNVVLRLNVNGKTKYFRECEKHCDLKNYIFNFTDYYFTYICKDKEKNDLYKKRVLNDLSSKDNYVKFINMRKERMHYHDFYFTKMDISLIGLKEYDTEYNIQLRAFAKYADCKLENYKHNEFIFLNNYRQLFAESRSMAYKAFADCLSLGQYVPHVEYGFIHITDKTDDKAKGVDLFGTLMDDAFGVPTINIPIDVRREKITPHLQRCLSNIEALDYLCYLGDHNENNYNVVYNDKGFIEGVSVFDNNEPSSFYIGKVLSFPFWRGISSFIDSNGLVNRPFFDVGLADKIESLKKKDVFKTLGKYLRRKPIYRVWQRVLVLKKAITKTSALRKDFLISKGDWTKQTIQEETSGKYGKTLLSNFLNIN